MLCSAQSILRGYNPSDHSDKTPAGLAVPKTAPSVTSQQVYGLILQRSLQTPSHQNLSPAIRLVFPHSTQAIATDTKQAGCKEMLMLRFSKTALLPPLPSLLSSSFAGSQQGREEGAPGELFVLLRFCGR